MKETLMIFLCIVFTCSLFGQKLELVVNKKFSEPEMMKKTNFDVMLINDTDAPIYIFYCHHKVYGGSEFSWETNLNGKQIKKGSMHKPMDTNSRFRKNAFKMIKPGGKKHIATTSVLPQEAGEYEVGYRIVQDPSTLEMRYAQDGAAKTAAAQLTPMKIYGSISFEVKEKEVIPFTAKDIAFEELSKQVMHKDFTDAAFDPSSIYRMSLTINNPTEAEDFFTKIAALKNLRELKLVVKTSAEFNIPEAVGAIPLMDFSISGRAVNTVFPDNFLNANSLINLNLGRVKPQSLDWVGNQTNLKSVFISSCNLKTIPDWIGNLAALERLSISDDEISTLPKAMENLTKLKLLQLHKNKLTEVNYIFNNVEMEELNFSENQIKTISDDLGKFTNLKKLNANKNQLTSLPAAIGNLPELKELWLENNQLTAIPTEVTKLQKMRTLYFKDNQVTALPVGISKMAGLRSLNFKNNKVKRLPEEILDMKRTNIFAQGNPLNKKQVKKMKKVMKRKLKVD